MLRLYNTLSKKIEDFTPLIPPIVGMYGCGPTVYDHIHIGNCRTFVFYDLLRKTLEANGFKVTFIQNITDVEDKIIKRSKELGISPENLTQKYTQIFFHDLNKLNILPANNYPKATEHIGKMIKFIEVLVDKKLAYTEDDGSVYFDVSEFENYGKLSGVDKDTIKTGTRILSDEYEKDDVQDFALWKGISANEYGWDSPWGKGRPGWHIECSVMSQEYLGETIDIHTGGIDLLFPHHENEIAQSEGVTGKQFVNYWVHAEHLLVDNTKMSKSKDNFYTLKDLEAKGYEPLAYRYLTLTAHYRDKLNFTWESLQAAQNALNNLRGSAREMDLGGENIKGGQYYQKFMEALNDDLNTPKALAVLWEVVKSDDKNKGDLILEMDKVLGLGLEDYLSKKIEAPKEVMELLEKRERARAAKNFKESDKLRKKIEKLGFEVLDTDKGPKLKAVANNKKI